MIKKKLFITTVALGVSLCAFTGCSISTNTIPATEEEVSAEATEAVAAEESDSEELVAEDANETAEDSQAEAPVVFEDFEGEEDLAIQRGEDVIFTVVDDDIAGSKVLEISGRTDSWNGANFACDVFRGNKIRANASVRSAAKTVRISIQYEANGAPVYNWVVSSAGNVDKYTLLTGTFSIPDDVENIFVYVESDSCDDIYIDEIEVTCEGTYKEPGEIKKKEMADISGYKSMKELYAPYFDIGVCINPMVIADENYKALILQQFSSVTMENDLKPEAILDREESLKNLEGGGEDLCINMDSAKDELDFAVENGLKVRGHTLIWHSQTPDWIFYENFDTKGALASRELMLKRVDSYFSHVFGWAEENYPGLFYAWDVVNEAVEDNGKMRETLWYETIGEDYIEQVFAIARKYASSDIKLFYNDYNSFMASKQKGIIEMLTPVAEAGNIDGVGMQAHLYTGEDPTHFAKMAKIYAEELGVIIHVTEMDVTEPAAVSPEGEQGKYYGQLFKALKEAQLSGVPIKSVSIWGISDNMSWKASERPLLFNADLSGKNAFYEVLQAAGN